MFSCSTSRYFSALWLATSFLLPVLQASPAVAAGESESNLLAKVKTAYLYNIAKFVQWPDAGAEVLLCVHSTSKLTEFLQQLDNREIGAARRLRVVLTDQSAQHCQIYFSDVPAETDSISGAPRIVGLRSGYAPSGANNVLLVSDHPNSLERGYVLQLQVVGGKLRFRYSHDMLAQSSFQVSSKLLALAMR